MNDISMIKKTLASICISCLVFGGCTEDRLLPDSRTPLSTETVTVKLTLGIEDYNTSSEGKTRTEEMPPVLSMSSPDMDVELVATPVATRAAASPSAAITEDNAVYSYMGFQFDGTGPDGKLLEKKFFTSEDGSIRTDNVEIRDTKGKKNMIVVLANVNKDDFNSITVDGESTYGDLQSLCMTFAGDSIFPRNKVNLGNNVEKTGIVMCGQAAAVIDKDKQLYISLKRTVARVKFKIKTTYPHFQQHIHTWNVTLMNIPTQNYYNIIGRKAIFPLENSVDKASLFWTKSLATVEAINPKINTNPIYIPINLQQAVPTSTQSTRRDNAPIGGTYLQIMGLEKEKSSGAEGLDIVSDFSIYQIFLGKNFTTDYSVYPNYDLTYIITLKGNSSDDSNVIRLIPGYFSGELTAYDANDTPVSANVAVKWKYPNRIESYFSDGYYPGAPDKKALKWYAGSSLENKGATSLTDGRKNTSLLQENSNTWQNYEAAYTCFRGTNGFNAGQQSGDAWWYLPSVSELIGTWISSSSTREQMADSYWSSTAVPGVDKAFVVTNKGEVHPDGVNQVHAVRASRDPDKAAHAGDDVK